MEVPAGLLYHPEHTWARIEGGEALIGITDFAQSELGDVVFIELPEVGAELALGRVFGSIESSKSVSELFSPVDGTVFLVNTALEDAPETVNDDPYGRGWIARVKLTKTPDLAVLLDAEGYAGLTKAP